MDKCLYCNNAIDPNGFSDEHVLPRKIGGNLNPTNPFIIKNVCQRCNYLAGAYIDSPFIKSWFTQNDRAHHLPKYVDLTTQPILPLTYMGICDDFKYDDKICEVWLGPTGDSIFHFHKEYPDEPDIPPMVGIPGHLKAKKVDIDPGFAFLFIVASNDIWHPTIIKSFFNNFPKAEYYLGNGAAPNIPAFKQIPDNLIDLHLKLKSSLSKEIKVTSIFGTNNGDRFLAKMGLGFGSLFLKNDFAASPDADLLRKFMWEKDAKERETIPIRGSSFINSMDKKNDLTKFLIWPNGHFFFIGILDNRIILYLSIYENQNATINISNDISLWNSNNSELIYVVSPGLQKFVGPKTFYDYIMHKQNVKKDSDLEQLDLEINAHIDLPPFHIQK